MCVCAFSITKVLKLEHHLVPNGVMSTFSMKVGLSEDGNVVGFRSPNLRKKQVKKKIFDNFLNFASKSSLRVTIWDNLPRWIVYVTLKLPTIHLTNDVIFKFNGKDYFVKLMQNRDYFLHFKKIETKLQNGSKVGDQRVYSLLNFIFLSFINEFSRSRTKMTIYIFININITL